MDRPRLNVSEIARALEAPSAASSDYDLNPGVAPDSKRPLRPAAVLVPLIEHGAGLRVILTRRTALLKHHPGQVAFPGGKADPDDAGPEDTALREAQEEIGLAPETVRILGRLDRHETVTAFTVTPVIGLVDAGFAAVAEPGEVEEVFEVPLDFALDPANFQVHGRRWQGHVRRYYVLPWGPHYIWGATARILKVLADRMPGP